MSAYSTLSKEQLIAEIKRLKKGKKFGLLWEDKPEDVAELCKTKLPVLVDVEDKEISDGSHKYKSFTEKKDKGVRPSDVR
jgi:hypothetical protein